MLGPPVVPFCPFSFWVPLVKPNSRKKGTLIVKGLLGNLVWFRDLANRNSFQPILGEGLEGVALKAMACGGPFRGSTWVSKSLDDPNGFRV